MICEVFDVHSHIVPGVDDGSLNFDMSIDMLQKAYKQGVRSIVCTSHDTCNLDNYMKNFKELQKQALNKNVGVNLYTGCEIYCDDYIVEDVINELNCGELLTINGTQYVLVEFDQNETVDVILECVRRISVSAYTPILAHTERYTNLSMHRQNIKLLKETGCLFQINAYSLVDESDKIIRDFAVYLLENRDVAFVGSDSHRTNHRPYRINNGINYIYKHCDVEYAEDICYRNAQQMLNLN